MNFWKNFTSGLWTSNECNECFQPREKHAIGQTTTPPEDVLVPAANQQNQQQSMANSTTSNDIQRNTSSVDQIPLNQQDEQQSTTNSTTSNASNEISLETPSTNQSASSQHIKQLSMTSSTILDTQIPLSVNRSSRERERCVYGIQCCTTNPAHFERYSHPPGFKTYSTLNSYSNGKSPRKQTPCRYGATCYRENPVHFEHYSHPPKSSQPPILERQVENQHDTIDTEIVSELKVELEVQQQIAQIHLELVEKQFIDSIAGLKKKHEYYEQEIEKLRAEAIKMAQYHQQLERALGEELNNRERREIEKQRILTIPRDTPSYWGTNAFAEPYREINIRQESPEFNIINGLLNGTIEGHNNKFGTIYGKDPTEFIITKITRIHNNNLWHEYCFKKESIIQKNGNSLVDCESSKYLSEHPSLSPLLDAAANEYWLFHGCDRQILPFLLHGGYDPRISNLEGMFGGGFYLAENSSKSNQYIPCPGCGKNSIFSGTGCNCKNQENLEFSIVLYRAVLGDVHVAKIYDGETYRQGKKTHRIRRPPLKPHGNVLYDSVMGESIKYGGNKLQYREFILYEPGQAYPEYVINFKRSAANARTPSDRKRVKDACYHFLRNTFKKGTE